MYDRKWQYKVETVKPNMFSGQDKQDQFVQERLNRLGMEGWELVSVKPYGHYAQFFFKR